MMYSESLRNLSRKTLPGELASRLRITASREALRRRRRSSIEAFVKFASEELSLVFHNLMRPYAVPAAGGLASTVVLFSILSPALTVGRTEPLTDVRTALSTEAAIESSISFGLADSDEILVDVWIDDQGKMTSYSIPRGQTWAKNSDVLRRLENTLLLTRFTPATLFGQPAAGRARLTLRRSSMDVRG